MKKIGLDLKILLVCLFVVPIVLYYGGGFFDYLSVYREREYLTPWYQGKIDSKLGTHFIYKYYDDRIPFYYAEGPVELYEWQVKSLGWERLE